MESPGRNLGSGLFLRRGIFFDNFSSEATKVSSGEENFRRSGGYATAEGLQPPLTERCSGGAGFVNFPGSVGCAVIRVGNGRGGRGYEVGGFRGV